MKTESVGICVCCAISQVDTNEFLISIPILHTPLYIKRTLLASYNLHLASWLLVAMWFSFLTKGMWQHNEIKSSISDNKVKVNFIQSTSKLSRIPHKSLTEVICWIRRATRTQRSSVEVGIGARAPGRFLANEQMPHRQTKDRRNDFGNYSSFPFFSYMLMTWRGYQRKVILFLSPSYIKCHKHLNLSLKQWTERGKNGNRLETHRLHTPSISGV